MAHEQPGKREPDSPARTPTVASSVRPQVPSERRPGPGPILPRLIIALLVGVAGGVLFTYLGVPLAWMLGPMTTCTIAAASRVRIAMPRAATPPMLVVVGVLLGSGFNSQTIGAIAGWWLPVVGMMALIVLSATVCMVYFRTVGKLDFATAYFSAMPGGVIEMIMLGEEEGGDARSIALIHAARVLLVVFAVPFLVQIISPHEIPAIVRTSVSAGDLPFPDYLWLGLIGVLGAALGHYARLPGKYLLGPILVSAGFHLAGMTEVTPPSEAVLLAQLVLGISIGCRFANVPTQTILWILALSLGSTAILLAMSVSMAVAISWITGTDLAALVLAYSPGGLAEMSLVALSLQIEMAFVAFLHIARVLLVLASASLVFRVVLGREKPSRTIVR